MTKIVEHLSALLGACSRVVEAATKTNYSQLPAFLRTEIENLKITSKAVEEETGVTSNYLPANERSFPIRDEPSPVRGNLGTSGVLEVIRRKKNLLWTRDKELSNLTFGRVVNSSLELYENETAQKAAHVVDLKGTAIATTRKKKKGEREKVGFLMMEPGSDTLYTMYCFPTEVYNWITSMTIAGGFEVEAESMEHAMNAKGKSKSKRLSLMNCVPSQESASNEPSPPIKEDMPVSADHRRTLPPPPAHSTPKENPTLVDFDRLSPMLPPNQPFSKTNPTYNEAKHQDGGQIRGPPGFKPWNKPAVGPGKGGRSQDSGNAGTPSRPAMAMEPNRYPLIPQQPVIPFPKVADVEPAEEFDVEDVYTDFEPTEDFENGKSTTMTGHGMDSFEDLAPEESEDIYADVEAYEVDPPVQQPPSTANVGKYPPLEASDSFDADEYWEVTPQEEEQALQEETKSYHQQKLPEQTNAPNANRGTPGWKPFQNEISPGGPGSHFAQLKATGGGTGYNEGNNGRSLGQSPGTWTKFPLPDDVDERKAPGGNGHLKNMNPTLPERKSSLHSSVPPKGVNFGAQHRSPGQNVEDNRRVPLGQGTTPMVPPKGRIDSIARKLEAADSNDLSTSRNEEQRKPSVPAKSTNFAAIQSALHGKLKPFQSPVPASKPTLGQARPEVPPAIPPHVQSANGGKQAPNPYSRPSNKPVPKEFFGGRQLPPPPPPRR